MPRNSLLAVQSWPDLAFGTGNADLGMLQSIRVRFRPKSLRNLSSLANIVLPRQIVEDSFFVGALEHEIAGLIGKEHFAIYGCKQVDLDAVDAEGQSSLSIDTDSQGPYMTTNAAFWNNLAEKYARKPVENPAAFERKITITKSLMTPRDVVLDIGCGTGSLAIRLSLCGAHIHGLDLSSEMIRIARGKTAAADVTNLTFHVGPFDDSFTVFEDESLRGICAYSLLHLVDDLPATLRRIFCLLEPGGFFVSSTVCLGGSWVPYRALLGIMRAFGKAPTVNIFSKRTLEDEVRLTGFVDVVQPDVGADSNIVFMVATKPR